ncbi:MAG TPA: POTRA domain-containing protein [Candidatus Aquilonibacter sp.]|nr:POTRA domain-containing protein [Candidatus Aquilonibacter sp.]
MSRAAPTPRRLLAVIWGLFCASGAYAQIPERVQRCLPYPTFAEEVASLHQESLGPSLPKVITIEAVDFDGPTTLPKANLARLVSNLEGRHFDAGSNWLDEVTDEWVRGAWQDDGYFKANATATTTNVGGDSENQHVALHVHVDEGLQYFMGDLRFQSADLRSPLRFTLEELSELVTVRNGDIFVAGRIRQSLDALRQLYASHGYIDFTLEPLFDVDDAARRISLTLQLDQQMQFRIGTVEISGFDSTAANVWKSQLKPGDVFDNGVIARLFQEYKSSLPRDASLEDVDLRRDVQNGIVDISFDFFECPQSGDNQ